MTGIYTKCIFLALFIIKVYQSEPIFRTFRCDNLKYITDQYFCDTDNDCEDFSDENKTIACDRKECGRGKFKCDGSCKNITVRCNRKSDCVDGLDELNCGDEIRINDCTLNNDKYLCEDKLRCIYSNYTCDGFCNCFDCSDESSVCTYNYGLKTYSNNALVTSACFGTLKGPICCSGPDSYCQECIDEDLSCDQKCVQFRKEQKCACDENYFVVPNTNNSKCWSNEAKENTLIYSTDKSIETLNLFTGSNRTIKKEINCTALVGGREYIYYAVFHNTMGHLFKTVVASNETYEIIKLDRIINSIATDWITNNVYYSTNTSISVCSHSGEFCERLRVGETYFIVGLAPRFGLMFWIIGPKDGVFPLQYLMRSSMDGSDEMFLTDHEAVSKPISMTIDELTERIYLYGVNLAEGKLSILTFSGHDRKTISLKSDPYPKLSNFIIFETKVYFTLSTSNEIYVAEKSKLPESKVLISLSGTPSVKYLYAYNPLLQRTKISNPCFGSCSGLCLLKPSSFRNILHYTCLFDEPYEHVKIGNNSYNEYNSDKRNTSIYISNEHSSYFGPVVGIAVLSCIFVSGLIGVGLYCIKIFRKQMTYRTSQLMDTNVSLQMRKNIDEPLIHIGGESSEFNENNFFR